MVAVITTLTFELIFSTQYSFRVLTTPDSLGAANIFKCGNACHAYEYCGGFVWDTNLVSGGCMEH